MEKTKQISEKAMKAFRDLFSSLNPEEESISFAEARRVKYGEYDSWVILPQYLLILIGAVSFISGWALLFTHFSTTPKAVHIAPELIVLEIVISAVCVIAHFLISKRKRDLWKAVDWERLKKFDEACVEFQMAYYEREEVLEEIQTPDRLEKLIEMDTRGAAKRVYAGPTRQIIRLSVDPLAKERYELRHLIALAAHLKIGGLISKDQAQTCTFDELMGIIDAKLCVEVGAFPARAGG